MENQNPEDKYEHNRINKSNNSSSNSQNYSRRGSNSHISMSDTESQASQLDSFHSPLRSDSPLPYASPSPSPPPVTTNSKALVTLDKYFSPLPSPHKPSSEHLSFPPTPGTPPVVAPPPPTKQGAAAAAEMVYNYNRAGGVREGVRKVERRDEEIGRGDWEEEERVEGGRGVGGEKKLRPAVPSILRRSKREVTMNRSALGFRVCEMVVCLVSFSVMAADKTQGWAGDSFDRYKEYRYT